MKRGKEFIVSCEHRVLTFWKKHFKSHHTFHAHKSTYQYTYSIENLIRYLLTYIVTVHIHIMKCSCQDSLSLSKYSKCGSNSVCVPFMDTKYEATFYVSIMAVTSLKVKFPGKR